MIAFDGYLFACSVHALDLAIGPGMVDLGETALNSMFSAEAIEDMCEGILVFLLGELDAVIRQERVNSVWQSGHQVTQQFRRSPFAFLLM